MKRLIRIVEGWLIEGWTRDLDVPSDLVSSLASDEVVEIYNAARPFPCHQAWQSESVHGIFYGLIYPGREKAEEYRERALALGASHLVFVSQAEIEEWGRAYCEQHGVRYEDFDFGAIARAFLHHNEE